MRQPAARRMRSSTWLRVLLATVFVAQAFLPVALVQGGKLVLLDNTTVEGTIVYFKSLAGGPAVGPEDYQTVVACNDQLRRYYVSKRYVSEALAADLNELPPVKIPLTQPVTKAGGVIATVGAPMRVTDFDAWGRRIFTMATASGPLDVVQGITEITARYCKLEALPGARGQLLLWDTRVATTSIPQAQLEQILYKAIDMKNLQQRMMIFNLYLQMERFRNAREELQKIFSDFPQAEADYGKFLTTLHQLESQRILREIVLRGEAGQHATKYNFLTQFPTDGVAGATLQQVQKLIKEHDDTVAKIAEMKTRLQALTDKLEAESRQDVQPVVDEIVAELGFNTIERMAPFETLAANEDAKPEDSLAMAISGWLLGSKTATPNLPVALSLYRVRNSVRVYMNAEVKADRVNLLGQMAKEEGAAPEYLAPMLAAMKPPKETPSQGASNFFELTVESVPGAAPFQYYVQLPPEYDPYKKYPAVVTLRSEFNTAQEQVDWWAGPLREDGTRLGQAARYGYIVISPVWAGPHQVAYQYSRAEHLAVLFALRDACCRFSVDTDRVFLSGHSMGGDAAWDIGLAHPDLWAGVIPVAGTSGKYVNLYWQNAQNLPLYFVSGELDSDRKAVNAVTQDKYLSQVPAYPVRVCEYLGRGHEHFSDEILDLFEWMNVHRRDFYPRKFECTSMRPWDNFFWWMEASGMPENSMVDPDLFDKRPRNTRPALLAGSISNNTIEIQSGAQETTVWLAPEMVDFNAPVNIRVRGRNWRYDAAEALPKAEVQLEDARMRGDRLHPFWAKVVVTGR